MRTHAIHAAVAATLIGPGGASLDLAGLDIASRRPYINARGECVIAVNSGQLDDKGQPVYRERLVSNATLRKDEWVRIDAQVLESYRERLVIMDDLRSNGLVHPVGGLGVLISEWEKSSEITDAEITMDGESRTEKDRQEFGINGVPIPIIQKEFSIGERVLLASRTRGAGLDVSTGMEAARAVARRSEKLIFYGSSIGSTVSDGNTYTISGLTNFAQRALHTIGDWSDSGYSTENILNDILEMVRILETQHRRFGPFTLYVPGDYAWRFRQDFKALGEKTLMERVMAVEAIKAVRFSDVLATGNVLMVQMTSDVLDLATAADVTTIQWASPSGWTNNFQVFGAYAPRLKSDYDGRCGILHATVGS
jgi:uncharacterized linocin/CFP29 family protein